MALPRHSFSSLEKKATDVISFFAPEFLTNGQPVPIRSFVEKLEEMGKLRFLHSHLGFLEPNMRILGLFTTEPQMKILIDQSLVGSVRYNFTLAHELGHFVLHRKCDVGGEMSDTSVDLFNTPEDVQTERQWAEWQANNFASALLMPRESIMNVLLESLGTFGFTQNNLTQSGMFDPAFEHSFNKLAEYLANRFQVSKTSVMIRLKKLK